MSTSQGTKQACGVIGIHRHRIDCIIGIFPEERVQPQTIFVDVKIKIDLSACLFTGRIDDTVDYVGLAQLCTQLAQKNKYMLLEKFAFDILAQCKEQFQALWGWVSIQKPSAIPTAEYAFVEMELPEEEETACGH
jgi:dihydroneopterin aldolase